MTETAFPPSLFWTPPAEAVTIGTQPDGACFVWCDACRTIVPAESTGLTAEEAEVRKRTHRCPVGTVGAFPTCPVCKATGKLCRNSRTLKPQPEWHEIRIGIWADAVGDQS